jgi:hypothetical protein
MFETVIVPRRSGLEMFEWLIHALKSLCYTINLASISRLNSSCEFVFFELSQKVGVSYPEPN